MQGCSAKLKCSAVGCRAYTHLTAVQIKTENRGSLLLPEWVVIHLCSRHFVLKALVGLKDVKR